MIKTDALIIGAGPTGLFTAHQLRLIGLNCEIVDNLDKIGGQCIELYPDKPIYDIPAVPECTGEELTNNLIEQIKAFKTNFHLNERVEEIKKVEKKWITKTNKGTEFESSSIIIAAGVGSFEPRKFSTKDIESFFARKTTISFFLKIKFDLGIITFSSLKTAPILISSGKFEFLSSLFINSEVSIISASITSYSPLEIVLASSIVPL